MMQVYKDMVCCECLSVNEHEKIIREDGIITSMIIRCKECGHEYIDSKLIYWNDPGCDPINFKISEWNFGIIEKY